MYFVKYTLQQNILQINLVEITEVYIQCHIAVILR